MSNPSPPDIGKLPAIKEWREYSEDLTDAWQTEVEETCHWIFADYVLLTYGIGVRAGNGAGINSVFHGVGKSGLCLDGGGYAPINGHPARFRHVCDEVRNAGRPWADAAIRMITAVREEERPGSRYNPQIMPWGQPRFTFEHLGYDVTWVIEPPHPLLLCQWQRFQMTVFETSDWEHHQDWFQHPVMAGAVETVPHGKIDLSAVSLPAGAGVSLRVSDASGLTAWQSGPKPLASA